MKRLFSCMKDYKLESILRPLSKMLETSFGLSVPLVVTRMVDVGVQGRDNGYIPKMGSVPVLLIPIGLACSLTTQYLAVKAATGAATSLRNNLPSHIGRLSYTEIDTVGTVALTTRMTSDISRVQSSIDMTLRLLLRSPFVVFGTMAMAFTADVCLAFVFIVAVPVFCVVVFGIVVASMLLYKPVQGQLDRVLLTIRENLLGVRVIRAFNRQKNETEEFDRENESLIRMQVLVGRISALLNPVIYVTINIAVAAVIWVGAEQVDNVTPTQGKMITLVSYMSQILARLIKMANLIIIISKAVARMNRVDGVFQVESSIEDRGTPGIRERRSQVPRAELKDMELAYAGAKEPALQDISFHATAGQTVGVMGGTGFRKSTPVNLIPRLYDTASEQVLASGAGVKDYPLDGLREKIGVVPQKSVLFKGTPCDNIC